MKREAPTEAPRTRTPPSLALDAAPVSESDELLERLLAAIDARGIPEGAWLIDIARVRRALQDADALLRRLEDAVIRGASSSFPHE
jgi:hypothetical protein